MARKILLADDSVTAQNMGRKILADAGYEVATVNNGSAALKRIAELKPDLIVLDVYMPGYSGLEVCQRLKDASETAHIPVLLTVGKLEPFKPDEARRVKADAHIVKPFEASELLSAIARLEELAAERKQSAAGSRADGNGRKAQSNSDSDTGWKSRLGFPSKKKKEEKEEKEESVDVAAGSFRDFRKGKRKGAGAVSTTMRSSAPAQAPAPDIPRDITPEELDMLSALAAKLDRKDSAADAVAPLADEAATKAAHGTIAQETSPGTGVEKTAEPDETPVEAVADTNAEVATLATVPLETISDENAEAARQEPVEQRDEQAVEAQASSAAPMVAESIIAGPEVTSSDVASSIVVSTIAVSTIAASPVVEAPAFAIEGKSEIEIPVEHVEPEHAEAVAEPVVASTIELAIEPTIELAPETVSAYADPAAAVMPIETGASASEQSASEPSETSAPILETVNAALLAEEPACVDQEDEPIFASTVASTPASTFASDASPLELAATDQKNDAQINNAQINDVQANEQHSADDLAPSDAELVQALRLLTPGSWNSDASVVPSQGTLAVAGQLLAEEAARNAQSGPRWVAESVALSPEEAAISLEAEMFRTFAAVPTGMQETARGEAMETSRISGLSAITAAVEKRLAAAEVTAAANTETENAETADVGIADIGIADIWSKRRAEFFAGEPVAQTTVTEAMAEETSASETSADAISLVSQAEHSPNAVIEAEKNASEKIEAEPEVSSLTVSEEAPQKAAVAAALADAMGQAAAMAAAAAAELPATEDVVPKAMAAAAAEGSASASASTVPDAGTIASIVESVMADLRPKIVAEITKKLAKQ